MSAQAQISDIIKSLEGSGAYRNVSANNLQLSDQIQFSQILKHLVDTPEKTLQSSQAPIDPVEQRLARRPEFKREHGDIRHGEQRPDRDEPAVDREEKADNVKEAARPDSPDRRDSADDHPSDHSETGGASIDTDGIKQAAHQSDANSSEFAETLATVAAPVPPEVVQAAPVNRFAPQAAIQTPYVRPTTDNVIDVNARPQQPTPGLNRGAENALAGALTDPGKTDFASDLHAATTQRKGDAAKATNTGTASSALAGKQADDLAQRLAATNQIFVNVNVADQAGAARSTPTHTLASGAELAQMTGLDSDRPLFAPNAGQNNNAGAENRGRGVDPQILMGRGAPQANSQDQLIFAQMMRQQASMANAQSAATPAQLGAKFAPTPADVIQTTPTSGPTGPSQISQTAKANPMTAARQPAPAQPPAEQIAVNIKKAIGAGADKINIKLHPETLGRVEVKLELSRDGHVQATIIADKPETLDMLQRDVRGLERALQEAGLRTSNDSLNFNLRGDANPRAEAGQNDSENRSGRPSEHENMASSERDEGLLQNNDVYGRNTASDGGVNILI